MIKRRYYKLEHGDANEPSSDSSSSSSSDSEVEADATGGETEEDAALGAVDLEESGASGYDSEDSSAHEIVVDSSGASVDCKTDDITSLVNKDDGTGNERDDAHNLEEELNGAANEEPLAAELPLHVLRFKSVYRCRICPKIVCLTKESMMTHINSKGHARSENLMKNKKLRAVLNSDGEIENQETPAESHARVIALAQGKSKKNNKGRQRQRKRSKLKKSDLGKAGDESNMTNAKGSKPAPAKKRREK